MPLPTWIKVKFLQGIKPEEIIWIKIVYSPQHYLITHIDEINFLHFKMSQRNILQYLLTLSVVTQYLVTQNLVTQYLGTQNLVTQYLISQRTIAWQYQTAFAKETTNTGDLHVFFHFYAQPMVNETSRTNCLYKYLIFQKFNDDFWDVFAEFLVSFSGHVKIVEHVFVTNNSITSDKAWIRVQI